jgi:hypothetical protein
MLVVPSMAQGSAPSWRIISLLGSLSPQNRCGSIRLLWFVPASRTGMVNV